MSISAAKMILMSQTITMLLAILCPLSGTAAVDSPCDSTISKDVLWTCSIDEWSHIKCKTWFAQRARWLTTGWWTSDVLAPVPSSRQSVTHPLRSLRTKTSWTQWLTLNCSHDFYATLLTYTRCPCWRTALKKCSNFWFEEPLLVILVTALRPLTLFVVVLHWLLYLSSYLH